MDNQSFNKISVVGLGYIGLPTAAMFASKGLEVIGLDVNPEIVDIINQGKIHIIEPGLEESVKNSVKKGLLRATLKPEPADAFLIAVPTPFKGKNHKPDLSYIKQACHSIAPVLKKGNLVILESTSPLGATEQMEKWLAECRLDLSFPQDSAEMSDIRIAHCPERVLPGKVMEELISNDRVIGGLTPLCAKLSQKLYSTFVTGECVLASDARVAEMAKLTENSFRDVNIAFANELSMICDDNGVNIWELISLTNRHPRVNVLEPGPGVGGHCIAVDPWFIVASSPENALLIKQARQVNDYKPEWSLLKIRDLYEKSGMSKIICYGLAFKPNIDDTRESPAMKIYLELQRIYKNNVIAVDPNIDPKPEKFINDITIDEAFNEDAFHVLLVDHDEFKNRSPRNEKFIDFKGVW